MRRYRFRQISSVQPRALPPMCLAMARHRWLNRSARRSSSSSLALVWTMRRRRARGNVGEGGGGGGGVAAVASLAALSDCSSVRMPAGKSAKHLGKSSDTTSLNPGAWCKIRCTSISLRSTSAAAASMTRQRTAAGVLPSTSRTKQNEVTVCTVCQDRIR